MQVERKNTLTLREEALLCALALCPQPPEGTSSLEFVELVGMIELGLKQEKEGLRFSRPLSIKEDCEYTASRIANQ